MAELSYDKRILILNDHFIDGLSYKQIEAKRGGVKASTAQAICNRTSKRAGSTAWPDLVANAGPAPRSGRPRRVEPGSHVSQVIRNGLRGKYRWHNQEEAANLLFKRARKLDDSSRRQPLRPLKAPQVHNIAQGLYHSALDKVNKKPITRKKPLQKIALEKLNLPHRERYIEEILLMKPSEVELILCDETPIDFGGCGGHKYVSAPAGEKVYQGVVDPRSSRMQWGAVSSDLRLKRRIVVWAPESDDLTAQLARELAEAQAELDSEVDRQRERAMQPGTAEHTHLAQKNDDVAHHNLLLPPGQRKGRKRRFTPERLYPKETITRDHAKGGLDAVFYAFQVYKKELFPYYEDIRRLNPYKKVYIIEDNVGVHHKARRILAPLIAQKDILFLDTPVNSPDLNPIEHLHKDEKSILQDFRTAVTGAGRVVQETAEINMEAAWVEDKTFAAKVAKRCNLSYLQALCRLSKAADPPYSNRYKDSL